MKPSPPVLATLPANCAPDAPCIGADTIGTISLDMTSYTCHGRFGGIIVSKSVIEQGTVGCTQHLSTLPEIGGESEGLGNDPGADPRD